MLKTSLLAVVLINTLFFTYYDLNTFSSVCAKLTLCPS